ncbi:nuclear transport factor 2 family protein [Sporosarcina sp. E16_8]|uniref:nuclear transport factor 2 family protein n=1 Tax=Sporosarcina sp. E16_8 TaxID=2789295 RepID=UPI001A933632|nr:nuclear transport factor 2 family protein [Sporosarcina sp. E16_8]MBO0588860.1 nuclear transport factor 2 family protein [Sporosarcina sp. E16_8]
MKKMFVPISMSFLLLLGACSNDAEKSTGSGSVDDGEAANENGAIDHGVDDKKVGFSLEGGAIEEASGVPAEEKEQILAAYKVNIDTLNEQDIDGYLDTLSPKDYDFEEERAFMEEQFSEYELNREVSNVTIVKYSDKEAQVFSNLKTSYKQLSTGLVTKQDGRQVTVFTKNDSGWKAVSVHYIGDEGKK